MKIVAVYFSKHKGNTKKLILGSINDEEIIKIDANKEELRDLDEYDLLVLASGVYHGNVDEKLLDWVKNAKIPQKVFIVTTSGVPSKKYHNNLKNILESKGIKVVDEFQCKGHDSAGIFKLIGGIGKNRPNKNDMKKFKDQLMEIK